MGSALIGKCGQLLHGCYGERRRQRKRRQYLRPLVNRAQESVVDSLRNDNLIARMHRQLLKSDMKQTAGFLPADNGLSIFALRWSC